MWKIEGACCVCLYKGIMILEQETITVELLPTKFFTPAISLYCGGKDRTKP